MASRGSNEGSDGIDKTKVLDVKPLRSLAPLFPSNPQSHPFPAFGPPSGVSPFYPFAEPHPPGFDHTPTPLRSYPPPQSNRGATHSSEGNFSSHKKARKSREQDVKFSATVSDFDSGITSAQKEDGDRELVDSLLIMFDSLRRRISQLVETNKDNPCGNAKRANLKASNVMLSKGVRTNMKKRIGIVPGIEVGDIFYFRMEMCLIGLHSQSMAGIDYVVVRGETEDDTLASSIVSSGGYDDDVGDKDILIYTGQGGNANKKDKGATDQKLVRGNLALERSLHRGNQVRVIRGVTDVLNPTSKIYIYDGLYTIKESWVEKGKSGCNIFKYKLVRIPGQPDAFSVWKSIEKWKEGLSSRPGLILPDLTSGVESIPVSLVNDIDEEKGPAYFSYFPTLKYSKSFKVMQSSYGCSCQNLCCTGDPNCPCLKKNGGYLPYSAHSVLVSRKQMVYECGSSCPCSANCKNCVSQSGVKVRLEVFKTEDRGWGLRSWDPIRAGTFICEYAGEVLEIVRQNIKDGENDDYIFDTSRVFRPFKWNTGFGFLDKEVASTDDSEEYNIPTPLIVSAKNVGNVARFMNHSCNPNIFWQPITYEQNSESSLHIGLFAMKHIPPMTELTYDYGSSMNEAGATNASDGRNKCLCRSLKCRGYFG